MAPQYVRSLIPQTCEYVPWQRHFEDAIKDLEVGRFSWIIQLDPKQECQSQRKLEYALLLALNMKEGSISQGM